MYFQSIKRKYVSLGIIPTGNFSSVIDVLKPLLGFFMSIRRFLRILLILCILLFAAAVLRNAWVSGDAYITFRTVDNFVNGYGLTWNAAERVQAYTHPLWMFLMSLFYVFTKDVYYTSISLCLLLSLVAVVLLAFKAAKTPTAAVLCVLILLFSKAFIDFSTAGMENALTHFLLILFLVFYMRPTSDRKTLFLVSLMAAISAFNRLDTILLFAPAVIYCFIKSPKSGRVSAIFVGFLPLIIWEVFSLIYYGFPFPNSAYAKLNTGIARADLLIQGLYYLKNSLANDPITLLVITAAVVTPFIRKKWHHIPLVIGVLLYVLYVVFIGGDFMSGRFLTAPLLAAVAVISRYDFKPLKISIPAIIIVFLLGFLSPRPTILNGADYGTDREGLLDDRKIADERGYYFQTTGLFRADGKKGVYDYRDAVRGREVRDKGETFIIGGNIGFFGYYAGPKIYILDGFALVDPLLARLPVRSVSWRIGHFVRRLPDGYEETLSSQSNQIKDKNIAAFYDRLNLITRGDIFDPKRLSTIFKMNTGQYNDYLEPLFVSRHYQDVGVRLFKQNKLEEAIVNLRESVKYDSTRSGAWITLGHAYMRTDRLKPARKAVLKATKLDPGPFAKDLLSLAIYHDGIRKTEEAIFLYKEYLKIHPKSFEGHVRLALAYELVGDFNRAVEEYRKGLEITHDKDLENHLKELQERLKTE